jgi:hypothetical protein
MAGFRGHFASKSRRYSTTLGAIRGERRTFRRRRAAEYARQVGLEPVDEDTTLVVSRWEFAGLGYLTGGDAALALSAAAGVATARAPSSSSRTAGGGRWSTSAMSTASGSGRRRGPGPAAAPPAQPRRGRR